MSFMYKTMMTRAPNKRKIKINEENILRLITTSEEEDEEDEDFVIPDQKQQEDQDDESDGTSEESEDAEDSDKGDDSTDTDTAAPEEEPAEQSSKATEKRILQKMRLKRRKRKKSVGNTLGPTVEDTISHISSEYTGLPASTVEMLKQAKRQLKQSENAVQNLDTWSVHLCGVCLDHKSFRNTKKLVSCGSCGISVHEDCYNVQGRVQKKGETTETWLCDSCVEGNKIVCEFCPNTWGCMKETKCGRWVHIVCARNILADYLYNASPKKSPRSKSTIYIQLGDCSNKLYGSKECIFCEDRLVAKTGVCIKCDAGFCKSTFHVTCAQKHGLLYRVSGSTGQNNTAEAYYANCPLHCDKEDMKVRQKNFILQRKNMEMKKERFSKASSSQREAVITKLSQLRRTKREQRDIYLPPKPPLEQVPRLLSTDAHFTRLLNNKAEQMFGITTKCPATIIPRPVEVRKRHHVVPSLTTDFASYYADRQLRVQEERSALASAIATNQELSEKQDWERHKYNEIRTKLISSKFEHTDLKTNLESLKRYFVSLHEWAVMCSSVSPSSKKRRTAPNKILKLLNPLVPTFTPPELPQEDPTAMEDIPGTSRQITSLEADRELPDADAIIGCKSCGICKKQDNQHMLVKCDVCYEWQHLGCLDPPLTQMPKRTKYSLWQCSECVSSSESSASECDTETRGSFTNDDGRRLTRRNHKAPDKLVDNVLDNQGRIRSRKMTGAQAKMRAKMRQRMRNAERAAKRQKLTEGDSDLFDAETPSVSPHAATVGGAPLQDEAERSFSVADTPTDQPACPAIDLPLGMSCDNYLSQAARSPTAKTTMSMTTTSSVVKRLPGVIVLKKPITVPRRPTGLGKSKEKHVPSPERRAIIATSVATALSEPGPSGIGKLKNRLTSPRRTLVKITKVIPRSLKKSSPEKTFHSSPLVKKEIEKSITVTTKVVKTPVKVLECAVCNTTEDQKHIITCDTCKNTYHWNCCSPPIKANPKRLRYILWECSGCVDKRGSDDDGSVKAENIQDRGLVVTPDGRKSISRRRKPPDIFEPAFMVSDQQRIFKTLEKKRLKKHSEEPRNHDETCTAARCKPIDQQPAKTKVTPRPPVPSSVSFSIVAGGGVGKWRNVKTVSVAKKSSSIGPSGMFTLVPRPSATRPGTTVYTIKPIPVPSKPAPTIDLTTESDEN